MENFCIMDEIKTLNTTETKQGSSKVIKSTCSFVNQLKRPNQLPTLSFDNANSKPILGIIP